MYERAKCDINVNVGNLARGYLCIANRTYVTDVCLSFHDNNLKFDFPKMMIAFYASRKTKKIDEENDNFDTFVSLPLDTFCIVY